MNMFKMIVLVVVLGIIVGCLVEGFEGQGFLGCGGIGFDKLNDYGFNVYYLLIMIVGIWVDLNGCDYWIIDDGVEGYLFECLILDGCLVCFGVVVLNIVVGLFKEGLLVDDMF